MDAYSEIKNPADFNAVRTINAARASALVLPIDVPDAALIRICACADSLMQALHLCLEAVPGDECVEYLDAIDDYLARLKHFIIEHSPATLDGYRALARTAAGFGTEYFRNGLIPCEVDRDLVTHLLGSLAS